MAFARRFVSLGFLSLSLAACAVGDVSDSDASESEARADTKKVAFTATWRCGEAGGDDEAGEPNDDGEYTQEETVVLGPIAACKLPAASRPAGTVCRWSARSRCWSIEATVSGERDAVLTVSGSAGDSDSSFHSALPLALVPRVTAWETSVSPDSASDAWGSATVQVKLAP